MKKVAWIGTGVMGAAMAANLKKNGYELTLYNRTFAKAEKAAEEMDAKAVKTIQEAVRDADVVISMVGYPTDLEEVMLSEDGVFEKVRKGTLIIDMTTSLPSLAVKLYTMAKEKGLKILDAPVSGGDSGARKGTLSIMVGGDEDVFREAMPFFECMGKNIVYMGKAGNGQHTKAANQIAVAGATAAYTEALHYSRMVGLDPETMLKAIGAGAAGSWQLNNMAPRVLQNDLAPGFFVKHFIKDMNIVKQEMADRECALRMLNEVLNIYQDFAERGHEDDGTQALILYYEE